MSTHLKDPYIWLYGLMSAFISGLVGITGLIAFDAKEFNFSVEWRKTLGIAVWLGVIGMINYLKKSPLPEIVSEETTIITKTKHEE